MTTITPPLLDSSVLPMVELLALCLDGHLYRVGDAFAPVDTPDGPELRARAFAASAPEWAVADRGSAAWIHGTRSSAPPIPQFGLPESRRGGIPAGASMDVSHRTLHADDTVRIAGVMVTTPVRTALDLAAAPGAFPHGAALEVRHLLELAQVTPAAFDQLLRDDHRKGCVLARSRVPAIARATLPVPDRPDAVPEPALSRR